MDFEPFDCSLSSKIICIIIMSIGGRVLLAYLVGIPLPSQTLSSLHAAGSEVAWEKKHGIESRYHLIFEKE